MFLSFINRCQLYRWVVVVSWLNYSILAIDLWGYSTQDLVKCINWPVVGFICFTSHPLWCFPWLLYIFLQREELYWTQSPYFTSTVLLPMASSNICLCGVWILYIHIYIFFFICAKGRWCIGFNHFTSHPLCCFPWLPLIYTWENIYIFFAGEGGILEFYEAL